MTYSISNRAWLENRFSPISLAELNSKAAMLERLDNKYVVNGDVLSKAALKLCDHFEILEIGGKRAFTYETWYFDDEERRCYLDHHQGRRRRIKVRVRKYTDAGICFVEVKLKDKRGITVKKRMQCDPMKYGTLDADAYDHIRNSYWDLYREEIAPDFMPSLEVRYRRMTLVAKAGGERMTIDNGLYFGTGQTSQEVDDELFIVETKSANGNGLADKVLRELNQHPTKHCSKYCIGIAATGGMAKFNKFRPALKRLGTLPAGGLEVGICA